ncbi:MAG: 8-amino-7-oxononanoate synthase [Candidatus Omnitrophica bacterium]|nr:8-amino-7-oxononanoate synthase [Candidatus Omnitrophota bacterium]
MHHLNDYINQTLEKIRQDHRYRQLKTLEEDQSTYIKIDGRMFLNFCSNNYLGLANDDRLVEAAIACMRKEGWGSGASRLVCGHMKAHEELENKIALFKGTERCLVFGSGYMANVGIISSLFDRKDAIFSDRLNHASIIDGIRLSQANLFRYRHNNMTHLEALLAKHQDFKKKVIITDSVFSMDGDLAPLDQIVALAERYECAVMIDEAHALGVMGRTGRGLAEHFKVSHSIDIQMGTLSKAVGSFGAYVCARRETIDFFVQKARSFIYTTALPPAVAAASAVGMDLIQQEESRREQLWKNTSFMHLILRSMGFNIMQTQTPIIPIMIGNNHLAQEFSQRLWKEGIYISCIRPPTVPSNMARLRVTLMATHTQEQLNVLIDKLQWIGRELGVV